MPSIYLTGNLFPNLVALKTCGKSDSAQTLLPMKWPQRQPPASLCMGNDITVLTRGQTSKDLGMDQCLLPITLGF